MSDEQTRDNAADFGNPASEDFHLQDYPFYLLSMIDHHYGVAMESVLSKMKMERIQWQLLLVLRERNPSSISELSEKSGRKLSTVSRIIERMRQDKLISTSARKSDNRITDVYLNEAGLSALDKVLSAASKQYRRAIRGFNEDEIRTLRDQLQRVLGNLDRSPYE